jgi:hypothetical protein
MVYWFTINEEEYRCGTTPLVMISVKRGNGHPKNIKNLLKVFSVPRIRIPRVVFWLKNIDHRIAWRSLIRIEVFQENLFFNKCSNLTVTLRMTVL